jgi:glycosyltransferase involved in cell wall biosynthesis
MAKSPLTPADTAADLDLIVLTFNEEANLGHCLASVRGLARRVFVVDSGSTDRTAEIARRHGAEVVTHPFTNQAEQFNWALDNLPLESGWVLRLDADEYLSPELRDEIARTLPALPAEVTGLQLKRRMVFLDRWIRHGGYYPTWLLRLFRRGRARSELAEMDEHIVLLEGETRRLAHDFTDHNRKGLSAWLLKHEAYASRQVRVLDHGRRGQDTGGVEPKLFGSQAERRRWLRHRLYGRAPLFTRAFLYFVYCYFVRLGFLDGLPGLVFHFLHAGWYLFYIDAQVYERRLRAGQESAAAVSRRGLTDETRPMGDVQAHE